MRLRPHLEICKRSWALLLCVALVPRLARAQSAEARERARDLAGQGFEALKNKDYASAEDLFRRADELVHAPTLELDHARALVGMGKLVEGHEQYEQVIREGVAANAPWQWRMAVVQAQPELAAVDRRLAWLKISVHGAKAPVVDVDGKLVPRAALGVRRATNPGQSVVSVRAEGFLPIQRSLTLQEGASIDLDLTLEADPSVVPVVVEPPQPERVLVLAPPPPAAAPDRTLPIVLLSVGGAALVAGGITGILTLDARSDLRRSCGGSVCVPTNDDDYTDLRQKRDKYRTLGSVSGAALVLGAGAALTGGAILLFSGKPAASDSAQRSAHPHPASLQVGLSSISLIGTF